MMAMNLDFVKYKVEELPPEATCSFCNNTESEVRIITGPAVNICNECVGCVIRFYPMRKLPEERLLLMICYLSIFLTVKTYRTLQIERGWKPYMMLGIES